MGKTSWKDYVMYKRKILERCNDYDKKLETVVKLQKVPITIELLQETGIGKVMKQLCKDNGEIGELANKIISKWKQIVASCNSSGDIKNEDSVGTNDLHSSRTENKNGSGKHKPSLKGHHKEKVRVAVNDEPHQDSVVYNDSDALSQQIYGGASEGFSNSSAKYENESVPYNKVSKYASYSDNISFDVNEYNPECPAIINTGPEYQEGSDEQDDYSVSDEGNDNFSPKGHIYRDNGDVGNDNLSPVGHIYRDSRDHNSRASIEHDNDENMSSQLKHRKQSCSQNGSITTKSKLLEKSKSDMQRNDKLKSRNHNNSKTHVSVERTGAEHPKSQSIATNGSSSSKRKHTEKLDHISTKLQRNSSIHDAKGNSFSHKRDDHQQEKLNNSVSKIGGSSETVSKKHHNSSNETKKEKGQNKDKRPCSPAGLSAKKSKNLKASLGVSDEGFTATEASFEDCLGFNDIVIVKKKKSSKTSSDPHSSKILKSSSSPTKTLKNVDPISAKSGTSTKTLKKKEHEKSKSSKSSSKSTDKTRLKEKDSGKEKKKPIVPALPIKSFEMPKPPDLDVDIMATLPEIQPNYRPLPRLDNLPNRKSESAFSEEEAMAYMGSRKEKTAVYSGRKSHVVTKIPSLFDLCTRILIDNIDGIEFIGGVPFMIMKPILERCTAKQLYSIEDYNPTLLEDTGDLWKKHCMRTYRNQHPESGETWRDLYIRLHDEQEYRLKSVTRNISASMSKATPVRQTKLAYIDSFVKPPREIARKQAKHGTAVAASQNSKASPTPKAFPRPAGVAIIDVSSPKHRFSSAPNNTIMKANKPRPAPLMMKTLKDFKKVFRR